MHNTQSVVRIEDKIYVLKIRKIPERLYKIQYKRAKGTYPPLLGKQQVNQLSGFLYISTMKVDCEPG